MSKDSQACVYANGLWSLVLKYKDRILKENIAATQMLNSQISQKGEENI